jgi:hypothetical protein
MTGTSRSLHGHQLGMFGMTKDDTLKRIMAMCLRKGRWQENRCALIGDRGHQIAMAEMARMGNSSPERT